MSMFSGVDATERAEQTCANCGKHKGTIRWGEGPIAAVHGLFAWWCECCALKAQIAHAEERARELENMKIRLAETLVCQ